MFDATDVFLNSLSVTDRAMREEIAATQDALLYELYGLSAVSAAMAERTECVWAALCAFLRGEPVHLEGNDPDGTADLFAELYAAVLVQQGMWAGVPYLVLNSELREVWDEDSESLPVWRNLDELTARTGICLHDRSKGEQPFQP